MYPDDRRNAQENVIQEEDLVLMKQKKTDKLSINFNPNPMKVVSKGKTGALVESPVYSTEGMLHISRSSLEKFQIHQSVINR